MTATLFGVATALAQDYPSKPIKLLVTTAPGGIADQLARIVSQHITDSTKQTVVVENRTGGGGAIAADLAAKSPADGYTVLVGSHATQAILPHINPKLSYDPAKDFEQVIHMATFPNLLVVNAKVPAKSVAELVSYAKENPGKLNFASQGNGSSGHMMGAQFKLATGTDIVHVPYRGAAPATQDLVAGQVQMMFDSFTVQGPLIEAGSTRALAITADKRIASLPNVQTMAEAGYAEVQGGAWFGIFVPAGTPPAAINWLNTEIRKAFSAADVRERFQKQGAQLVLGSPQDFSNFVKAESKRWGDVVTKGNIRIEN
jgi:tripartite-type tricarboxylate transporter receptor subunit TctC